MSAPVILAATSTKGGVGKTTLLANISAVLADIGLRVLMVDADVQPSLSKFYPLNYRAPNGIVELLLGDNFDANVRSTVSNTVFPNLDIIISNNISADIQTKIANRADRAFLLKAKFQNPFFQNNYNVILIDTQGAVGALQDTASFAASCLITPIMPEILSAREFVTGTQEALSRLAQGEVMGLGTPQLRAVIYAQDRSKDAKLIAQEIREFFSASLDDRKKLLQTTVPEAKSYKEAATLRIPVHCHEQEHPGKLMPAYEVMHNIVYEIFPGIQERQLRGSCFNNMTTLLPEEKSAGVLS
ncbi:MULTISPECIES: ParA family protein [unclassified Neisseria]|uniref:ParA family protein n=1 Tax=unclassified Neisseria TaxID=2623750 RepID=UPI0010727AE2|nr:MULTISPECIES: ParA family protein [unclassified Neisseria]MBF0803308.1 ParA family protein [Neisseria sp. 19428wB4_WF04]TFU43980.1 ParA family protein [Neisseria sp. WF04]